MFPRLSHHQHSKITPVLIPTKVLLASGSIIIVFALFMTSLCKQYYQFFLAQGLLLGLGLSLVVLPAFAVIPRYFTKHRGLAMGLVVSGSSMGGVIWPITLRNLFTDVGFGWGVRICAFMMLPLLSLAVLAIRVPISASSPNGTHVKAKPDVSIVKSPILILLALGLFLVYLGLFSPFFYVTSWTISLGLDADMGFYMVSIINAASLFERVLPGLWADRVGPYNIMVISAGLSGLICMCWTEAKSIAGIVVLSLAYGFASGVCPALSLTSLLQVFFQMRIKLTSSGCYRTPRCLRISNREAPSIRYRDGLHDGNFIDRVSYPHSTYRLPIKS